MKLDRETHATRERWNPAGEFSPSAIYQRQWALTLLDQVFAHLRLGRGTCWVDRATGPMRRASRPPHRRQVAAENGLVARSTQPFKLVLSNDHQPQMWRLMEHQLDELKQTRRETAHHYVLQHLCEELTATETVYPGTNLRLIYQLVEATLIP